MIAGRLAEDINAKVLILEAGPDNADLENVHMAGGQVSLPHSIIALLTSRLDGARILTARLTGTSSQSP